MATRRYHKKSAKGRKSRRVRKMKGGDLRKVINTDDITWENLNNVIYRTKIFGVPKDLYRIEINDDNMIWHPLVSRTSDTLSKVDSFIQNTFTKGKELGNNVVEKISSLSKPNASNPNNVSQGTTENNVKNTIKNRMTTWSRGFFGKTTGGDVEKRSPEEEYKEHFRQIYKDFNITEGGTGQDLNTLKLFTTVQVTLNYRGIVFEDYDIKKSTNTGLLPKYKGDMDPLQNEPEKIKRFKANVVKFYQELNV